MMLYPAMSKLNSHVPNRYMLVNVVARRAARSPMTPMRPVFSWMKSP